MRIDHIGYAVKNMERGIETFQKLGFTTDGEIFDDVDRNVKICFMKNASYRIELLAYLDRNKRSPIDDVLNKNGPTPYHICYITKDLGCAVDELQSQGFKVIIPPSKAVAFNNKKVVFLLNLSIGIIEIVEDESYE